MTKPVQLPRGRVTWPFRNPRFQPRSLANRKPITSQRPRSCDVAISGSVILLLNIYWPEIGPIIFFWKRYQNYVKLRTVINTTQKKEFSHGNRTDLTLHPPRNKTLGHCHVSKLRNFELPGGWIDFNCSRLRRFRTRGTSVDVTIEIDQP